MNPLYFSGLPAGMGKPNFTSAPNVFGMDIGNMGGTPKQGNWFEKIGNFLSSKDEQVLGDDGRVLPTNTFQATPTSEFLGVSNVKKETPVSEGPSTKLITMPDGSVRRVPSDTNTPGSTDMPGTNTDNFPTDNLPKGNGKDKENDLWSVGGQQAINKDYLENLGETSKDLAKFQALLGEGSKLADRMSLGYMMEADAFKNQADRSVTSNMALLNNMGLNLPSFKYDIQQFV